MSPYTTTAGLEPAREFRSRFLVYLLNPSDKLPKKNISINVRIN